MGGFNNAKMVKINNKEVDSIKTNDGGVIYQKPISIVVTGNSISLGYSNYQSLITNGNVIVNWDDGTQSTVNNSTNLLTHSYTDNKQSHNITFLGIVTSIENDFFEDCSGLTNITIPLSVTNLGNYCFHNCTSLTSIVIPNSITNLKDWCFYGCTGLTSITIPNSITSIGNSCFYNCTHLTSITIPSSITSLGEYCFYGCTNLNTYQLYWTSGNIITYDSNKMPNNTNTKFYVPKGQKINYVNKGYPSAKVIERS